MATTQETRYEFGKNWTRFVRRSFNDERVEIAKRHMLALIRRDNLVGLDFLDIGCGSGVHSLAACQAGAGRVHSFDYDADSVTATNMVRRRAGEPANWIVERGDVLADAYIESLGKWNFVYSWGVLHHTGDVWRAIANAQKTVAEDGLLYIALYSADVQTDPNFWLQIKKKYNQAGPFGRWRMEWWYVWRYVLGGRIWRFPTVIRRVIGHRLSRGMSFFSDIRDWLGGWPMEFTADREVIDFLENKHGFRLINIKTGEACTEFVFERSGATESQR